MLAFLPESEGYTGTHTFKPMRSGESVALFDFIVKYE